ncbi:M20/M25/M40 family metallo-hydrolase [Undibacterium sp. Rencai35W]|uniref:M20/M25/M40 family metallo-hydrolase n=1 Tax=Undibacterium sp. Rencai35W TaxID=3413046 RepID=UPI003BF30E43
MRSIFIPAIFLLTTSLAQAQDTTAKRIVDLGKADPQVMTWLDVMSNRFGGRMTGSDAYTHTALWAKTQLGAWGLASELEEAGTMPLGFNRGPSSGRMLLPLEKPLRFTTPAYSSGTKGVQSGTVVIGPHTLAEAKARKNEFKNAWVLIEGESTGEGRDGNGVDQPKPITLLLIEAGALGTIQSAEEPLFSATATPTHWENLPNLPDIKLAEDQYLEIKNHIKENLSTNKEVRLEFDIRNWFYPGPVPYHNVLAKIKGSERPEEIVILGAHLDSFDGGTGAADNGAGFSSMMEAMRLLAKSGVRPRRTILMIGFAGEELGCKGAYAFAQRHAGELDKVVMMLNRDTKPGAITGITVPTKWQSVFDRVTNDLENAHPVFEFQATFNDIPRDTAKAFSGRASSDDAVFTLNGVPTPKLINASDFDYAKVHHTVLDTYEQVRPFRTAQQYSAITLAIIAYEVANAPEEISRQGYYLPTTAAPAQISR